jgi:hypothetical protein
MLVGNFDQKYQDQNKIADSGPRDAVKYANGYPCAKPVIKYA